MFGTIYRKKVVILGRNSACRSTAGMVRQKVSDERLLKRGGKMDIMQDLEFRELVYQVTDEKELRDRLNAGPIT